MTKQFKIIVEKHADGYVAYPLGLKGIVVGQGDTYKGALADTSPPLPSTLKPFMRLMSALVIWGSGL